MSTDPVTRLLIADHEFAEEFSTGHVEVRRITMAPHVKGGPHDHNGPVFGVITRGSAEFQVGDGPIERLGSGATFYEPGNSLIGRFDSLEDGVEFLAWFPLASGEPGLMTPRV